MHAIAVQGERLVDLHVARGEVLGWVDTKSRLDRGIIHPTLDPLHLLVAKRAIFVCCTITSATDIVWVEAGF